MCSSQEPKKEENKQELEEGKSEFVVVLPMEQLGDSKHR
jgi:hypothetical protein